MLPSAVFTSASLRSKLVARVQATRSSNNPPTFLSSTKAESQFKMTAVLVSQAEAEDYFKEALGTLTWWIIQSVFADAAT